MAMRGFTLFSFRRHANVVKLQPILGLVRINDSAQGLLGFPRHDIVQVRKEVLG
jgi:hypothetical protein